MWSDRQPHARIIGAQSLVIIHRRQWRSFGSFETFRSFGSFAFFSFFVLAWRLKELTSRPHTALHLPQRASPLIRKRIQRADIRQRRQLVAAQARALHD